MNDTVESLVGRVQQRTGTLPDYFLIVDWLSQALRDHARRREWSWRRRNGQFMFFAPYTTGTVSISRGDNIATFAGSTLTQAMVGQQLRLSQSSPIRTIVRVNGNVGELDLPWGPASAVAQPFEIYQAYVTAPADFDMFLAVVDPIRNFQLDFWSYNVSDFDRYDPRRAYSGSIAYYIALRDFSSDRRGTVGPAIQAHGAGNIPVSGGEYTGPSDALFAIEMTSATVFKWKKGTGATTSGVTIDPDGIDQALSDGVSIAFPNTVAYSSGDIFIIQCSTAASPGLPRFEPWPHKKTDECLPYLYLAKIPDLTDSGFVIPRYASGDLLVERALASWARWPGTEERKNPAFRLDLATMHDARAERIFEDLEREDNARTLDDVMFSEWTNMPTGVFDSTYLATHDAGYEINVLD